MHADQSTDLQDLLSKWTGRFVDPARELAYLQAGDRAHYRTILGVLGCVALLPAAAAIADYVRNAGGDIVWTLAGLRFAMVAGIGFVLLAARKTTLSPWFPVAVWIFCSITILANVILVSRGGISWQIYSTTIAVELFILAVVFWRRPLIAYSTCAAIMTAFAVHGAIEASDKEVIRIVIVLTAVMGISLEFVRRNSITDREAFAVREADERAQVELKAAYDNLKAERDAVEEAAVRNVELAEDLDMMRRDAERQAQSLDIILNTVAQGISVYDADFRMKMWNKRFVELLDLPEGFAQENRRVDDFTRFYAERGDLGEGDPAELAARRLEQLRSADRSQTHRYERRIGSDRVLEVVSNGLPDGGVVTTFTDITDRKKMEEAVHHMALHDALTGLANRRGFNEMLHAAAERAAGEPHPMGLAMLDLDGFKAVNDGHGHPVGDELLKQVGAIISDVVRAGDCVARLGGDEFAILFSTVQSASDTEAAARRIIERLQQPIVVDGRQLHVGTSIGLGFFPTDADSIDELIAHVDAALYEAKEAGKGCLKKVVV